MISSLDWNFRVAVSSSANREIVLGRCKRGLFLYDRRVLSEFEQFDTPKQPTVKGGIEGSLHMREHYIPTVSRSILYISSSPMVSSIYFRATVKKDWSGPAQPVVLIVSICAFAAFAALKMIALE